MSDTTDGEERALLEGPNDKETILNGMNADMEESGTESTVGDEVVNETMKDGAEDRSMEGPNLSTAEDDSRAEGEEIVGQGASTPEDGGSMVIVDDGTDINKSVAESSLGGETVQEEDETLKEGTNDRKVENQGTEGKEIVCQGASTPEDGGSMVIVDDEQVAEIGETQTLDGGSMDEPEQGRANQDESFEEVDFEKLDGNSASGVEKHGDWNGSQDGEEDQHDGEQVLDISLDTLPTNEDAKVKRVQDELVETIMLLQVIKTLGMISRYLRITTNATADTANLLISQQAALFDTLKLCDNFSLMMQGFQSGANNILEKLKIAYLYLLDGFPDFAMTDIAAISKDVDSMKTAVGKMQKMVSERGRNVARLQTEVQAALDKLREAEEQSRLSNKPNPPVPEESSFQCVICFVGILLDGAIWCVGILIFLCPIQILKWLGNQCIYMIIWFQEKITYKSRKETGNFQEKGDITMAETIEIVQLKSEMKRRKETIYKLRLVLAVLEQTKPLFDSIGGILMKSSDLVQKWYKECVDIVEPNMAVTLKAAERLGQEEKMKYWTSLQFQKEVFDYYCRWRALQVYSEANRSRLRQVRQEVEGYYTENLLPRDAVKFSWTLARREQDPTILEICQEFQQLMV